MEVTKTESVYNCFIDAVLHNNKTLVILQLFIKIIQKNEMIKKKKKLISLYLITNNFSNVLFNYMCLMKQSIYNC